jgi:hypothetical protein
MPKTADWPTWLDEASDSLQNIYWGTKGDRPPELKQYIENSIEIIQNVEQVFLYEEVSEQCELIFKNLIETNLKALEQVLEATEANRKKGVGPTPLLDEMKALIIENPELLQQLSDAKLARMLTEASHRGLKFSREYVRKYRKKIENEID